jgi:hypothetical protein
VLDAEKAIDNRKSFSVRDIAEEIEFISLDNNDRAALIGDIKHLEESKSRFYIYDNPAGVIKIFDKAGKFISTIGGVGRGPDEYITLYGITVDYDKDNLYAFVAPPRGVVVYDITGRIFARMEMLTNGEMTYYSDKLIMLGCYISMPNLDSLIRTPIEIFSSDLNHESSIKTLNRGSGEIIVEADDISNNYTISKSFLSHNGNSLIVKEGRTDTVFHYQNGLSLKPVYVLDFGSHAPPVETFGEFITMPIWNNRHYGAQYIYEADRYLIVVVQNDLAGTHSYLIFDMHNPSDGFMATGLEGQSGLFVDGIKFIPCYVSDNRLVGYVQAFDIIDNIAAITNPDLKTLAATLKEDDNPVIVIAKLKK